MLCTPMLIIVVGTHVTPAAPRHAPAACGAPCVLECAVDVWLAACVFTPLCERAGRAIFARRTHVSAATDSRLLRRQRCVRPCGAATHAPMAAALGWRAVQHRRRNISGRRGVAQANGGGLIGLWLLGGLYAAVLLALAVGSFAGVWPFPDGRPASARPLFSNAWNRSNNCWRKLSRSWSTAGSTFPWRSFSTI